MSWFTRLFIDEAKRALKRHSGTGSGGSSEDDTQMYILVDEDGTEIPAVLVEEATVFDATANDIREGKLAATDAGVILGTKEIPAYIVTEGIAIVQAGNPMVIKPKGNKYAYTKLLAVICKFNSTTSNSVAVDKSCISDKVYPVSSVEPISSITVDEEAKAINLGIVNEDTKLVIIRYFTYKEEY